MITQELLQEYFRYEDGKLIWKINYRKGRIGKVLGSKKEGYLECQLFGKRYPVHHLIWLYHHGYLPKLIDHINQDRSCNKIENLRETTKAQNARNSIKSSGATGIRGVSWCPSKNAFECYCTIKGKKKYLGLAKTIEEGRQKVRDGHYKYFGEYPLDNVII